MNKKMLALALVAGCGATGGGAILVDQNRQAAALLVTHPDPAVSTPAKDIQANSETLLKTDYEGKLPPDAPVYTPEVSKQTREAVEASHEASKGFWDLVQTGLGAIPGGGWAATAVTAGLALWERIKRFKAVAETSKAKDLAVSTFEAIQGFRKAVPEAWEALKGKLIDSHDEWGVRIAAKEMADTVKG